MKGRCPKCEGSGQYKTYGQCFSCKGTGLTAVFTPEGTVIFQGTTYIPGDTLPFNATSGRRSHGKVTRFYLRSEYVLLWDGTHNLNDIWFELINIKTGKKIVAPFWQAIKLLPAS